MTKEEILRTFADINYAYNNCSKYDTLNRMLDEFEPHPKMGRWFQVDDKEPIAYDCSECGAMVMRRYRFCPECGAKMEREDPV